MSEPPPRGDPLRGLRWTCQSRRTLARELRAPGHAVSHTPVAEDLHLPQYRLKGTRQTPEGAAQPDRTAQFLYSPETASAGQKRGEPVSSLATKKKELSGNYTKGGQEGAPTGAPREVKGHACLAKRLGKALPYGAYDIAKNKGLVSVGSAHDTGECAVQTLRRWWTRVGRAADPKSTQLSLTADGGGSKARRRRLCKLEVPKLAEETTRLSPGSPYPPGRSKGNKSDQRRFCHLTANGRAVPLESRAIIVELISHPTPEKGLSLQAELDPNPSEKGRVVTKQDFAALALTREAFHGEWTYTLAPRHKVI